MRIKSEENSVTLVETYEIRNEQKILGISAYLEFCLKLEFDIGDFMEIMKEKIKKNILVDQVV